MKRIMQSTLALAIAMTFSVVTVKAQELEEIIVKEYFYLMSF